MWLSKSPVMTVGGAWPDADKKAELGQAKNAKDYVGKRLAADAAGWIHGVLNSLGATLDAHRRLFWVMVMGDKDGRVLVVRDSATQCLKN